MSVRFQKFNRPTSQGIQEEKELMQRLREEHLGMRNTDGTTPEVLFSGTMKAGGTNVTKNINGANFLSHHPGTGGKTGRYMERIDKIREKTQMYGTQRQNKNKKLNNVTKNLGNQEKMKDVYQGKGGNGDIEDLNQTKIMNSVNLKNQTIQNMASVLEQIGTDARVIKDGKLYNNPLEARIDGYQAMCDQQKDAKDARVQFESMRRQMYGYNEPLSVNKNSIAEKVISNPMTVMSRDEAVQKVFEKYNKKPLLDDAAEALLKRNTKRRAGLSDAPKSFKDAVKAMPGYDLPLIRKRQGPLREDLVDVVSPGYTKQVAQLLSSRGPSQNPVSDISMKNVSNSYSFGASFFTKFQPERMTTIAQSSLMNTKQFHEKHIVPPKPKFEKAPRVQKDVKRIMERASASPPKQKFEPSFVPDPMLEYNSPMSMMMRSLQTEKEQKSKAMKEQTIALNITKYKSDSLSSKNSPRQYETLQDKTSNIKVFTQFHGNKDQKDSNLRNRSLKITRKNNMTVFKSPEKNSIKKVKDQHKQRQASIEYQESRLSPQVGNRPAVERNTTQNSELGPISTLNSNNQSTLRQSHAAEKRGTASNSKGLLQGSKGFLEISNSANNSITQDSKPSSTRNNNKQEREKQQTHNILSIQPHQQKKTTWTVHNAERAEKEERQKKQKAAKQAKQSAAANRYQTQVQPKQVGRESNNNIDIEQELVKKSIDKEAKRVFDSQDQPRRVSQRKKSITKNEKSSKKIKDGRNSSQMYKTQIGERGDEEMVTIMTKDEKERYHHHRAIPKHKALDFATFDTADIKQVQQMQKTFNKEGSPREDIPRIDFLAKRLSQPSGLRSKEEDSQMRTSKLNWIQKQAVGGENVGETHIPFESSRLGQTSRLAKQKEEDGQIYQEQFKYNTPGQKHTSPIHQRKISIEQPYQLSPHQTNGLQNYTVDMFDNSPVGISQMSVRESGVGPSKASAVMPRGSLMMFGANDRSSLLRSSKNEDLAEDLSKNTSKRIDEIQNNSNDFIQNGGQSIKDNSIQDNSSIPKMNNNQGQHRSINQTNSQKQFYHKEKNEITQVVSFDIEKDITKTTLNMRSGSLQKFEQDGLQQFPLIEEDIKEQILSEENTHDSNVVKEKPQLDMQFNLQQVSATPSQDIDYKPEYDYLHHQMDPKLHNQTYQIISMQPSPKLTRRANKQNTSDPFNSGKKDMVKKASVESPNKQSSKKWINATGSRVAAPRSPKVEQDKSKSIELTTTQKTIFDLQKDIEEEPLSINLPSPEPGMRQERNINNDSGSGVIDEQHMRQSISKAVKKITRLKGSRGVVGLVQRLTRAKGQKRDDVQYVGENGQNEEEDGASPLQNHARFEEHQKRPSKWLGLAAKTIGGKPKSFTLRELEKAMLQQPKMAKTMQLKNNSDLNDLDKKELPFGEEYGEPVNGGGRRNSQRTKNRRSSQGSHENSQKTLKSKGSKGSKGSLEHGLPKDHDWEKTPIYRQFVLHEPEHESLKDTEIMRRMIRDILDDGIKKKMSRKLTGKFQKVKKQDSNFGSIDSKERDFNADKHGTEILKEALDRTRKKMLGEVEIDYLLEMLKKRDVNKEIVQENEKKLYFKKAKVTLEVHMAKMGLHTLYKTIIEQYETMLKLEKSKPFDETLIKLLYRCLMNKRSIQKAQKIFKLIEKRDLLLHDFEDLVTPCGEEGHQDAELLSDSRRVGKQEKVLTQVCQTSSRLFIQVAQFLDESNHFKGQKFIYQQQDLQKVLREDILRLRLEYQSIFINTIPIMDKYGMLQFNQDRTLDNGTVSLKAKDDTNMTNDHSGFQLASDGDGIGPMSQSAGFQGWNTNRDRQTSPKSRAENEAIEEEEEHGESEYDSEYSYFD